MHEHERRAGAATSQAISTPSGAVTWRSTAASLYAALSAPTARGRPAGRAAPPRAKRSANSTFGGTVSGCA